MVLVGIFVALPVVLYGQFESADRQMRDLVTRAIQDRSALIADALAPKLRHRSQKRTATLNADLAKYSSDGTVLKLMFQPGGERTPGGSISWRRPRKSAPTRSPAELDELGHRGILQRMSDACMWDAANEIRYKQADGTVELLTSIIPIRTAAGCWVLTSTHATSEFLNTSIGRPYWETREIRVAAVIYLVLAVIALPGRRQHPAQPAPLPRRRRRDQPGPHRRLRLQPPQCRARALERGPRLRQAGP